MKSICTLFGVVAFGALCFWMGRYWSAPAVIETERIKIDTVERLCVRVDTVYRTKVETRFLRLVDTVATTLRDTVLVEVPISEYRFREPGVYDLLAEGFDVKLRSIQVYPKTVYRTETVPVKDGKRWGFGIQAGYGIQLTDGSAKFRPYIGFGVSYDLIRW